MELDERWDCRIRVPKRSKKRFDKARYPGFKYKYDGPGRFHFEASGLTRPQRDPLAARTRGRRSQRRDLAGGDRRCSIRPTAGHA